MQVKEFKPNYLRNKGKSFDKHKNGVQAGPGTKKKTVIPGAIKTVADVPQALKKTKQRNKGKGKTKSRVDRRTSRSKRQKTVSAKV